MLIITQIAETASSDNWEKSTDGHSACALDKNSKRPLSPGYFKSLINYLIGMLVMISLRVSGAFESFAYVDWSIERAKDAFYNL
jgi:hypothetical protein